MARCRRSEPVLDETKVVNFPILPNDSGFTTYTVELSGHSKWSNNIITTVRLDPVANVSSGRIEVDWISVNNSVNLAPSFAKGPDQIVNEDSGQQLLSNWAMNLSPGSTNETTQTVTFVTTNDNPGLFAVQPFISRDGTLSHRPAANSNGSAIVTVKLRDDGGSDTSAPQTFIITVREPDPKILLGASIDPATGEFKLMVTGVPGRNHSLQVSVDLRRWDPVTSFAPASGIFEYVDSAMAGTPFRFYRVLLEP